MPFENTTLKSQQPCKVTARLGANHTLSGIYQGDRLHMLNVGQTMTSFDEVLSTGGAYVWRQADVGVGTDVTTTFTASYNNKGATASTATRGASSRASIDVHPAFTVAQGRATGTGCS